MLLVAGAQFIGQPIQNPPVTNAIKAPEHVTAILRRACYDCHSNETNLSWIDKIAPASWLVAADVKEARSRFNFSTWDTLSAADQQGRMWEVVNMILAKKMPLRSYAALHPSTKISQEEVAVVKNYVEGLSPANYHDTAVVNEAEREFASFSQRSDAKDMKPVAANGVEYIPNYQDWQVISTTNRFDNHSIRVVYGNAIAVKAIRPNKIRPFPNGSTIVKAVWNSIENENGDITPGSLNSIQMMTKDNARFPGSKGWGFAKFNGISLKPYGATKAFNTTCFNCHKIAGENDYLFNLPLENTKGIREMFDADSLRVIASFANTKEQTMSVLYGNSLAKKSALAGCTTHAPGERYKLVTYTQADNKYWYGSHINGEVKRIETVTSGGVNGNELSYVREKGDAPVGKAGHPVNVFSRINEIFSHRPSVFP